MMTWAWLFRGALAVLLCAGLNGCLPSGQSMLEEEKEPHYLTGKSCISRMDYKGAIEAFETALELNPHSASAHFQLGWLYEEKEPDPAAAIYHYEQFLKLRPNADNGEVIRQHINNCKQDLARTVLPLPVTPGMQREFEQLAEENKRLRDENEKWKAYFASQTPAPANPPGQPAARVATGSSPAPSTVADAAHQNTPAAGRPAAAPTAARTHVVQSGDTPSSIARKYGLKLDALMNANPGLDPRRLRVGQTLNLPPS
jgi:tetratricopeptide (TPR) repeat protein